MANSPLLASKVSCPICSPPHPVPLPPIDNPPSIKSPVSQAPQSLLTPPPATAQVPLSECTSTHLVHALTPAQQTLCDPHPGHDIVFFFNTLQRKIRSKYTCEKLVSGDHPTNFNLGSKLTSELPKDLTISQRHRDAGHVFPWLQSSPSVAMPTRCDEFGN